MPRHLRFIATLALELFVCSQLLSVSSAQQSTKKSDPLKPYLTCEFDDGLYIKETAHRGNSAEQFREIKMGGETKRVSVIDGYRIMFAYKKARYYFANVKVEQSDPKEYDHDKESIISMLKYYASTEKPKMIYRDKTIINGYEDYGADREVMDYGGVIGNHVIFHDANQVIITIYFLNQGGENRRFNSLEEYQVLRNRFLDRYTQCVQSSIN